MPLPSIPENPFCPLCRFLSSLIIDGGMRVACPYHKRQEGNKPKPKKKQRSK